MKLYKLVYIGDEDSNLETFRQTEVMTENGLRTRLKQAIQDEQLCQDTLELFDLDKNTDCHKLTAEQIVEIFDYDGYEIDWQYDNTEPKE